MKKTDDDPDVPPKCQDPECPYSHHRNSWPRDEYGNETCPTTLERQRYQRRRWARRHPMDAYDREQRRLRGE